MDTTFHLNWIRETGHGHLDADFGAIVPARQLELALIGLLPEQQPGRTWGGVSFADLSTPWRLPEWARRATQRFFGGDPQPAQLILIEGFCNRIRDKAWNISRAQLFLPCFGRREWNERFSLLPEIGFHLQADDVIADGVDPNSLHELAMRVAASAFLKAQTVVPARFETRLPLIDPWRNHLLDRYGLDLPPGSAALSRLTLTSSGAEMNSWHTTPRERQCHYYSVFSHMALTLQHCLRRWTLATFALDVESLADFDTGADVLVYSAVRPHAEKRARDFSYDVLNADMLDYAFGRSARRLEPILETANDMLENAGRPEDARLYLKRDVRIHSSRLLQRARRRPRVRGMLVSEGVLIYSLMKFANRIKLLDSAHEVTLAVRELTRDFEAQTRRIFFFLRDPGHFATLLFLEASNAINCAMGGDQCLRVDCLTNKGAHYRAARPVSETCSAL